MAKLAARPRHGPRKRLGADPTRPIIQLCAGDVDLSRAPRAAVDDFLANREPPPEEAGEPGPRRGGREIPPRPRASANAGEGVRRIHVPSFRASEVRPESNTPCAASVEICVHRKKANHPTDRNHDVSKQC